MFSGIWTKLAAFFAALAGIALIVIKSLSVKNKKLEHEIEVKDKKEEIRTGQEKAKSDIIEDEKERVKTADKSGSRADRLNRL